MSLLKNPSIKLYSVMCVNATILLNFEDTVKSQNDPFLVSFGIVFYESMNVKHLKRSYTVLLVIFKQFVFLHILVGGKLLMESHPLLLG